MKRNPFPASSQQGHSLDHAILDIFRARGGGIVSGEELSSSLKVSRTAVWKHIKSLQNLGYSIAAVPSKGYRLLSIPDILFPAELAAGLGTRLIGNDIIGYAETDSTNIVAFKRAEEGAEDGSVVIANAQRHGKGRLGRSWISPSGVNVYCSVILRPPILPTAAFQLTFLSAVAVARAVEECTTLQPLIKWPNDILVNGQKVAGLLNEMSAETEKVHFIVLGIGVNLNMQRNQFPADLRHPATSLFLESGVQVNRIGFVQHLLRALDDLYGQYLVHGYEAVRAEWLERSRMVGRTVSVSGPGETFAGSVRGIDDNGALLVTLADGTLKQVLSGDVSFTA